MPATTALCNAESMRFLLAVGPAGHASPQIHASRLYALSQIRQQFFWGGASVAHSSIYEVTDFATWSKCWNYSQAVRTVVTARSVARLPMR